jgi:hypothetical protein
MEGQISRGWQKISNHLDSSQQLIRLDDFLLHKLAFP